MMQNGLSEASQLSESLLKPNRRADFLLVFEAMKSVIPDNSALYVSAPITSGRRFHDWLLRGNGSLHEPGEPEYGAEHQKWVVEPNRKHAAFVISDLRIKRPDRIIIDPTAMGDLPKWTQQDYRYFWGEVIRRFVSEVVFVDDWHFSSGCAYEFLIAKECGLPTLDESEISISLDRGLQLLRDIRSTIHSHSDSVKFLDGILSGLMRLQTRNEQKIYV